MAQNKEGSSLEELKNEAVDLVSSFSFPFPFSLN